MVIIVIEPSVVYNEVETPVLIWNELISDRTVVHKSTDKMAARRVLSDDIKNLEFETSEDVDVTPTFDSMGLREELLRGIYAYGNPKKLRIIVKINYSKSASVFFH